MHLPSPIPQLGERPPPYGLDYPCPETERHTYSPRPSGLLHHGPLIKQVGPICCPTTRDTDPVTFYYSGTGHLDGKTSGHTVRDSTSPLGRSPPPSPSRVRTVVVPGGDPPRRRTRSLRSQMRGSRREHPDTSVTPFYVVRR